MVNLLTYMIQSQQVRKAIGHWHRKLWKEIRNKIIRNKINIIIGTYTDSLTALKRDYKANLSLEKRSFLSKKNVDEYNSALVNINKISKNNNINFNMYDTTTKSEREVSFEIIDTILSDMRWVYIEELDKIFTF